MTRKRGPRPDAPSRLYASRVRRGLKRLEVWLPDELLARLDRLAAGLGGRPEAVRQAIAEACDARAIWPLEPVEKKEPTDP